MHAPGPLFLGAPAVLVGTEPRGRTRGAAAREAADAVLADPARRGRLRLPPRAVARLEHRRWRSPCWCSPSAPRSSWRSAGSTGCGSSIRRSATPTASTTRRCAAWTPLSMRLTGATQRGSLPLTQATILGTLVVVPLVLLVVGTNTGADVRLWDSPVQFVIGLMMVAAALAATVMRNRLASVILVGLSGYGCGVLFALHGAPDLALTQFLVETLTLVIFVLVFRKLPAEVDERRADRIQDSAGTAGGRGRCHHHHDRRVRHQRAELGADLRATPRRGVLPRQRQERRQRPARRHPCLGHARRDLGAAGGGHGRREPGVPQPPLRQRAPGVRRSRGHGRFVGVAFRDDVAARRRPHRSETPVPGPRGRRPG